MMFNKVILLGNLTRDIEMRYASNGAAIGKTAIATTRKYTSNTGEKREEVCFVDITFFGRTAEVANQYLRKGRQILVEGRLVFEQWQDQNGQNRSKHSVTVESMQMLGGGADASNRSNQNYQNSYNQGGYQNNQNFAQSGNYANQPNTQNSSYNQPKNSYQNSQNSAYANQQGNQGGGYAKEYQNRDQDMDFSDENIPDIDIDDDMDELPF